jgi:hypothetical protein
MTPEHAGDAAFGPAQSSALFQLAVAYNDALDRCTQTGGANVEEVMAYFADDAIRVIPGLPPEVGKEAIRASFLRRSEALQQVVELKGVELWGDLIICRLERRDSTLPEAAVQHNVRILLVKGGKVQQLIVVVDPDQHPRLRAMVGR